MSEKKYKQTIFNIDAAHEKIQLLDGASIAFTHSWTSGSHKIEYRDYRTGKLIQLLYVDENIMSERFIIMLSRIKKEIESNFHFLSENNLADISSSSVYHDFSDICYNLAKTNGEVFTFENCYEADITAAYYQAARNLKLISQSTYDEIINKEHIITLKDKDGKEFQKRIKGIPKNERLRLLGSIATVTMVEEHDGGEIISHGTKRNPNLRFAWNAICNYVNGCMKNFKNILGDRFIFYWVDGIYFDNSENIFQQKEFSEKLDQLNKHYKFDWKIIPLKSLEVLNKDGAIELIVEKPDGKKKPFFIPARKIRSFKLE